MVRVLLIALLLMPTGCSGSVEPDDRPPFQGKAILYRQKLVEQQATWEKATFQLRPDAVAEVLKSVEANGLMHLHRAYHADVSDGTQWVLWIKQGERFHYQVCRTARWDPRSEGNDACGLAGRASSGTSQARTRALG
jgi:hypothetical protein